jgi:hypothetical protein
MQNGLQENLTWYAWKYALANHSKLVLAVFARYTWLLRRWRVCTECKCIVIVQAVMEVNEKNINMIDSTNKTRHGHFYDKWQWANFRRKFWRFKLEKHQKWHQLKVLTSVGLVVFFLRHVICLFIAVSYSLRSTETISLEAFSKALFTKHIGTIMVNPYLFYAALRFKANIYHRSRDEI